MPRKPDMKLVKMIGSRLRSRREQRGLTQQELADRIGANISQIVRWESGRAVPSGDAVSRLSKELEVTADWLLGNVDQPDRNLTEADLSPMEWKLIEAYRRGDLQRLLYELATDEILAEKMHQQSNVASHQPAVDTQAVQNRK